ncbi:MAG TPA: proline dehydrogenase family protein [Candidatus Acidoferrales bacterium]|jgi:proline dehydrogenase|nr:proline dehydrogenase family protein [Candidatus Acidoferrales bacterium]
MMRAILLKLSNSPALARWVTTHKTTRRMSQKFVAGEELDQAVAAARVCNGAGLKVSLDLLGESVTNATQAGAACDAYLHIFDRIAAEKLDANVSLKLTQLGLDIDAALCQEFVEKIVAHATSYGNFVRVDMEGSPYTARTIDLVKRVRAKTPSVGVVVQSYLRRTESDVPGLLAAGCRLRLCKGAYKEPPDIAFPEKRDVDANYVRLMKLLLPSGIYHGIATHDPRMIAATEQFAAERGIGKNAFEFQMLYGIRTDLQRDLVRRGYTMRVYIPYGRDWFPYFMRRLAERPANMLFFLKNLFRG